MDTSGYKGWWPMKVCTGMGTDGEPVGRECFRNVVDGRIETPENGWDGEPSTPTGELATMRHASDAYRRGWERIWGAGSAQARV